MELKEIRSLVELADVESITMVAERLHLSPAAIHKQLKVLQAELGIDLYHHVGRNLVLTPAAQMLLPYLRDLLAQYESILTSIAEWKGLKRGVIRIGAGPTISSYMLPILLKKFRRACAGIELIVETGNTPVLLTSLRQGTLDLALIVSPDLVERSEFRVEAHWDFELVPVTYLPQAQKRHLLSDLKPFPFILFQRGSRMAQAIERYFATHGFEPRVIMRFDNAEAIKAMIRSGLGISILPAWTVDSDIRQRRLSWIRLSGPPIISSLALVSRRVLYQPAAVKIFIETSRTIKWRRPLLASPVSRTRTGGWNSPVET